MGKKNAITHQVVQNISLQHDPISLQHAHCLTCRAPKFIISNKNPKTMEFECNGKPGLMPSNDEKQVERRKPTYLCRIDRHALDEGLIFTNTLVNIPYQPPRFIRPLSWHVTQLRDNTKLPSVTIAFHEVILRCTTAKKIVVFMSKEIVVGRLPLRSIPYLASTARGSHHLRT